jgi:uncharacterized protein YuzE
MKFSYYSETDSLYIELSSKEGARTEELSEGIVLDFDDEDNIVGIDIDNASEKVNLEDLSFSGLRFKGLAG